MILFPWLNAFLCGNSSPGYWPKAQDYVLCVAQTYLGEWGQKWQTWAERDRRSCCALLACGSFFFTTESSYFFKSYGLLNQTTVQNFMCFCHCYWTDMFQGIRVLGIWQILHIGKGTACSKRPTPPWKISWKTKMNPHTHEHACVNRTSSEKFLRKTWMI